MLYNLGIIHSKLCGFRQAIKDDDPSVDQIIGAVDSLHSEFQDLWSQIPEAVQPQNCKLPYVLALQ
jgi:hypothetical protein